MYDLAAEYHAHLDRLDGVSTPRTIRGVKLTDVIIGKRNPDGSTTILLGNRELHPSLKHSYDFEWGYGGSGPAETAWVILSAVFDKDTADDLYQHFKWEIVAGLPRQGWAMTVQEVMDWVREKIALPV
mgnify:CR=1 FL=1